LMKRKKIFTDRVVWVVPGIYSERNSR